MADNLNIFAFEEQDIDLKDSSKIKVKCFMNDDIILKMNVYNYGESVNLADFNKEIRFTKPDGNIYSETNNISFADNLLTVICDRQLTVVEGVATGNLRLWNTQNKQKSSYPIEVVIQSTPSEIQGSSQSVVSVAEQLNNSIVTAKQLETHFDDNIKKASITNDTLKANTSSATNAKTKLETATTNAEAKKQEVNVSITNATDKITEVKQSISSADNSKKALDVSNNLAVTNTNNLGINIDKADKDIIQLNKITSDLNETVSALNENVQNATNIDSRLIDSINSSENIKIELNNILATSQPLVNHMNDNDAHIKTSERNNWNKTIDDLDIVNGDITKNTKDIESTTQTVKQVVNLVDISLKGSNLVDENVNKLVTADGLILSLDNFLSTDDVLDLHTGNNNVHVTKNNEDLWNTVSNKVDKVVGKILSTNDFTNVYKTKLDNIEGNANNYIHPSTHLATIIVEDSTHRFTTDSEKINWNTKASTNVVTNMTNGLMSNTDKTKLDGISINANKVENSTTNGNIKIDGVEKIVYTHPAGTNPHNTTKNDIGLGNVDNTSDINKPISTATQNSLDNKIDKVIGKSLILDSEIERLASVRNYDSTNVITHIRDKDIHATLSERNNWNNNIEDLKTIDEKLSKTNGNLEYTSSTLKQILNLVDLMLVGTNVLNEDNNFLITDTLSLLCV